ncbi:antiporter [Bacillus thuringiensis serovar brasilensis]|uniref:MFS transporter n=1 Tax=Bacillus cereus group TaxID=86661 RepID=UPI000A38699F|nr:MFS transporter [Bacillus thuringiensis]MCU5031415.1 MFS transporter [Bacillus cereus]MRA74152.1 MFS transporter [Bacillus thuringiensis]MRA92738.1 MFS transporter [Bacillus thuringiensis]MRC55316.1 MFS transporter [Bacillus thuringiensis]OTX35204.1 antiporter [Bacillus thuringiensis serovar brasilensis]
MKTTTIEKNEKRKGKLILILAFALVISVMNSTMFNIALPTITNEFHLKPSQAGWIVTGYIIVYAIGSVMFGKLADKYKLKNLLTVGLLIFAFGSLIVFFASTFGFVLAGRILQALGASVMPATSMIIPTRYFTPETRGRALGITSSATAFGTAVGPIVAGLVTNFISWHYLFIISLLILLTIPFFRIFLDNEEEKVKNKTDLIGAFLLAGTLAFVLLAITQGDLLLAFIGIVFFFLFLWRIRVAQNPFIQGNLFKNKNFSAGLLVSALSSGIGFGIPYLTPLLLQGVNGLSPLLSGLVMFPGAFLAATLGRKGGKLADQKGNEFLAYTALFCFFIGYGLLSIIAGSSPYFIMVVLIFACVGQTFIQISLGNTVSRSLPKEQAGVGMGIFMMMNFIAGATATTLISKALEIKSVSLQLNPFLLKHNSLNYSNIYTILAILIVIVILIYRSKFRKEIVKDY